MTEKQNARYLDVKRRIFDKALGATLNERQREAVCSVNGPLLVLAGAGSGKTTVLVRRIAFLIRYGNAYFSETVPEEITEDDVDGLEAAAESMSPEELGEILPEFIESPCPPWAVLAITFTNKAANEIKERLGQAFHDEGAADEIWAGTFHSVCMRILRRWCAEAVLKPSLFFGLKPGFSIYDTTDKKHLVTEVMKELEIDDRILPVRAVMNAISREKDNLRGPGEMQIGRDPREKHIQRIYEAYDRRLAASNAVDFDDIIMKTVLLLREHEEIRSYYQHKFRYVSVDEYQDTNAAQFELTKLLSGYYRNLMVVGDDDQSIYKFRGATIENILQFDRVFADAKVVKLEQNYRSTGNILAAANAVIAHNTDRHEKKLWCAAGSGSALSLHVCADQNAESRYVVDKIMDLVIQDKRRYRDFAVLYRVNELGRGLETAFAKSGVPYRVYGGQRFYDRKEIRDMIAYLNVIVNRDDDQRLYRIVNEPKRKIGGATLEAVAALAAEERVSAYTVMENAASYPILERVAPRLSDFVRLMEGLREDAASLSVSDLVRAVFEKSGYHEMLKLGGEATAADIDSVEELISAAKEYESRAEEASAQGFLEEVALVSDVDQYDENADACVLMTVHSAKGLEFPVVFLVGMEEGIFPGSQSLDDPSELSEERRLAYVAITRAKEKIFITAARERLLYAHTAFNRVSRFVRQEIPAELIAEEETAAPRRFAAEPPFPSSPRKEALSPEFTRRSDLAGAEAAPTHSFRMERFAPGTRVRHASFGEGEILSVRDMGGDLLYEVRFDSGTVKRLMATYAKLEKL